MTLGICPRCQKEFVVSPDTDDYEHTCDSSNLVLGYEDVVKTGDWQDYTGSGSAPNHNLQGVQSELRGTKAGILGAEREALTLRGNRASTHRSRQHLEFIEIKEKEER